MSTRRDMLLWCAGLAGFAIGHGAFGAPSWQATGTSGPSLHWDAREGKAVKDSVAGK